MTESVHTILPDVREALVRIYGDRLVRLVLYGSHARGDAGAVSDVDLLVVLRGTFDLYDEIRQLTQIQLILLDRHGVSLSMQPYSEDEFEHRQSPFLINVRREGVEL